MTDQPTEPGPLGEIEANFVRDGDDVKIVAELGAAKISVEYNAEGGPDDLDTLYGALPQIMIACFQASGEEFEEDDRG